MFLPTKYLNIKCRYAWEWSADTWRLYNVSSTSMCQLASTLRRRCLNVMCQLGGVEKDNKIYFFFQSLNYNSLSMDAWLHPIYFGSMSVCLNLPNLSLCISTLWLSDIRFWYVDRPQTHYKYPRMTRTLGLDKLGRFSALQYKAFAMRVYKWVEPRYLELAYFEWPLISKWKSSPCFNTKLWQQVTK